MNVDRHKYLAQDRLTFYKLHNIFQRTFD